MSDDTMSINDELAAMRTEMAELRAEVARLRRAAAPADPPSVSDSPVPVESVTSRRRLFALAGGAAAASVIAGGALGRVTPAAAANGDIINIANNEVASAGAAVSTFLNYSLVTSNPNRNYFLVADDGAAFTATGSTTAAIAGWAAQHAQIGVAGTATIPGGKGVVGRSTTGTGVVGESDTGWDFLAGGTGRVYMAQAIAVGPPTVGAYSTGEIIRDGQADLWICTNGGSTSAWRKLGGATTAGSLHVIEPTRVYDSRLPGAGGPISSGSRTIVVANGIDLVTGATNAADIVPAGATAIQFTFTIDGAVSGGFLAVTPGDAATYKASTINWSSTTPNIATGALVKIDGNRAVKVFVGGGGSTNFIIDVTGYYR